MGDAHARIEKQLKIMADLLDVLADRKFRKIVTVVPNSWGKHCKVTKSCKSRPTFMLFGDDGKPKLSRLAMTSCAKHLALAVKRLHPKGRARS